MEDGKKRVAWDVACFGELVMDMVPHSIVDRQWFYLPSPGGAPGNVAVGLAKLGRRAVMLSKVGDEAFGSLIISALQSYGVGTAGIVRGAHEKTGLSVVTHGPAGERDFIFYRDHPADLAIDADDVKTELIENASIAHFGVVPLSAARSSAAQRKAVSIAKAAGKYVSFDPNFRPALWPNTSSMLQAARECISQADIVKLSEDELFALAPGCTIEEAVRSLWCKGLKIVTVTKGKQGAELFTDTGKLSCEGFAVDAIDTTAAGDAFMASLLSGLIDIGMAKHGEEQLALILRSACAAGALATTVRGAMASLPDAKAIAQLLRS